MNNNHAATAALALRGTPFRHQGRDPNTGVDCVGLVLSVATATGGEYNVVKNYSSSARGPVLVKALAAHLIPSDNIDVGCVLSFWINRPSVVRHLGIAVAGGFVHAKEGIGVLYQNWTPKWRKRVYSIHQFPHLAR